MLSRRIVVAALAVVALAAGYWFMPALGAVSRDTLLYSVTTEVGGNTLGVVEYGCRLEEELATCEVPDASASGAATYRVRRDGRCWSARKVSGGEEVPLRGRASHCVTLAEQLRLFHRLIE